MDVTMLVIDHIDNLKLSKNEANKYFNELKSLSYLACGLWFLYDQVLKIETQIVMRSPKNRHVFQYGNSPYLEGIPQDIVACAFHWYAVTVCNYVKMVGWLVSGNNSIYATDYLKRVIPPVKVWRDKVGAHFARHSPKKDDNAADLVRSVMFPPSFDDDAFYVGSLSLAISSGGQKNISRKDMRWSLTHTHRDLIPRYWPSKPVT
jgi:hypothetical protein